MMSNDRNSGAFAVGGKGKGGKRKPFNINKMMTGVCKVVLLGAVAGLFVRYSVGMMFGDFSGVAIVLVCGFSLLMFLMWDYVINGGRK